MICPICSGKSFQLLIKRDKPSHVICRNCGLVFQNPLPTLEEMNPYYKYSYWKEHHCVIDGQELEKLGNIWSDRSRAMLELISPIVTRESTVLEIGCGYGRNLACIKTAIGCRTMGVEPSENAVNFARDHYNLNVQMGTWESVKVEENGVDLILMIHVLEHFEDPNLVLKKIHQALKQNRYLYIEVPNILKPNPPSKRLSKWFAIEHNYYFSLATLTFFLQMNGFSLIRSLEDIFVRVLAKKVNEPIKAEIPHEYSCVRLSVLTHDIQYRFRAFIRFIARFDPRRIKRKVISILQKR